MIRKKKQSKLITITIGLMVLVVTACQPTPDEEVVVNKESSSLDELIFEKADPNKEWIQIEDNISWTETKTVNTEIGECIVTVSMNAEMPHDPSQVPVYLVAPGDLNIDFLLKASELLLIGEKYDAAISKQDIMADILAFEKDVFEHKILDGCESEVNEYSAFLYEEYNKAPEINQNAIFEFVEKENGYKAFNIKSYGDDNRIMKFAAYANDIGRCDGFYFRCYESNISLKYLNNESGENIETEGTETTFDEALAVANNVIESLFIEPYAMVHVSIIDKTNYLEYLWNSGEETSLGQAYVFYYVREYDGIPSLYIDPASIFVTENTEYSKPYIREYACIVVDDRGVLQMWYNSYSNTIEKLNENVKLMPFDDVVEQFKNYVFYHSLWGRSSEIAVTRIEFGMIREPVKDNPDQYLMVPAWNFIGDIKRERMFQQNKSILVLNALNGSIATDYESISHPK